MKNILVTGCAGTIGTFFIKSLSDKCRVVGIDCCLEKLQKLDKELCGRKNIFLFEGNAKDVGTILGNKYRFDMIYHFAASKDIVECENNKKQARENNIDVLACLLDYAVEHNIPKFLFTSSDKAVNPIGLMGKTKKEGEILVSEYSKKFGFCYFSVRLGNVLGSSGSIVPVVYNRIKKGQDIHLTHPGMSRFVMDKALVLELFALALKYATGGEIFSIQMKKLMVADLIEAMIKSSNRHDIGVEIVGTRLNEKMYEELFTLDELKSLRRYNRLFVYKEGYVVNTSHDKKYFSSLFPPYMAPCEIADMLKEVL